MHVKDLPRRAEKLPVIKGVFLGWLSHLRQEPGYFAYTITYGVTDIDKGEQYQGHLMWAGGLDKPWRRIESRLELNREAALTLLAGHEKLAAWPEGNVR
jgi:hypothetical protein